MKVKLCQGISCLFQMALLNASIYTLQAQTPFSDVFTEGSLNPAWTLEEPNPDSSYQMTGSSLQITASWNDGGSDLYSGTDYSATRVLQPVNPALDWIIETGFSFSPGNNYQGAGILLADTNGIFTNDLQFSRVAERAYYPDAGGSVIRSEGSYVGYSSGNSWMRIEKIGTNYIGWFSPDGVNWTNNGTITDTNIWNYFGVFVIRYPWDGAQINSVAGFNYFDATVMTPLSADINYIPISLAPVANAVNARIINCPTGMQNFAGVPFNLLPATANNSWDAIGSTAAGDSSVQTMNLPVQIYGATAGNMLINLSWGDEGKVVPATFTCSDGSTYTFNLAAGAELRDWLANVYVNDISDYAVASDVFNGTSVANPGQAARIDMQTIPLPASFATKVLTNINVTDYGPTGNNDESYSSSIGAQRAFVYGVTVATTPVFLNVSQAPGGAVVSWNSNYSNYGLQTCTNLLTGPWTAFSGTPFLVGNQFYVTNAITNSCQFFRLFYSY